MPKISHTAQIVMDLYYQSYSTDESFFKEPHFRYLIGSFYTDLLIQDYKASKAENLTETGIIFPTFNQDLFVPLEREVNMDGDFKYVDAPELMYFPYDNNGFGVGDVRCLKNQKCNTFKRTSANMKDKLCILPYSDITWFWTENKRIYMYGGVVPKKVVIVIIPEININDDDFIIPQSYEGKIITSVFNVFKQAQNGVIVDMSNNSNPNVVIQNEIARGLQQLKPQS